MNEKLILNNYARFYNPLQVSKFNIFYPSFDLLEKSPFYQCFTHRLMLREMGVDFNDFEEKFINPEQSFEEQFKTWMNDFRFKKIREFYEYIAL
jgi:hypothetical protein